MLGWLLNLDFAASGFVERWKKISADACRDGVVTWTKISVAACRDTDVGETGHIEISLYDAHGDTGLRATTKGWNILEAESCRDAGAAAWSKATIESCRDAA